MARSMMHTGWRRVQTHLHTYSNSMSKLRIAKGLVTKFKVRVSQKLLMTEPPIQRTIASSLEASAKDGKQRSNDRNARHLLGRYSKCDPPQLTQPRMQETFRLRDPVGAGPKR